MEKKVNKSSLLGNYFGQLVNNYPEKEEMLEWLKYAIDNRVYYYGNHFKAPYESRPLKVRFKEKLVNYYHSLRTINVSYEGAVISNAYFNVSQFIREEGFKVVLPPWLTGNLSKKAQDTLYRMMFSDFNIILSEEFQSSVYTLRDELSYFFQQNRTPFVLLANDLLPIHRIAIDVCRELGIPTGIFLHGLPGPYSSIDDSRADYLFVWGEKIRDNYINAGSKANIIVVGHPNFSSFKVASLHPQNVVVLTRAICGAPSMSDRHHIHERGLCIQHIYAVESALKRIGIERAVLRLHPSENPAWYEKFMDRDFYKIDTDILEYTIGHAKMVVGPYSTVSLHTVLNDVPYYPYIIDQSVNMYASEVAPPFSDRVRFPAAFTTQELEYNIRNNKYVTKEHFEGYVNPEFDITKITQYIKK